MLNLQVAWKETLRYKRTQRNQASLHEHPSPSQQLRTGFSFQRSFRFSRQCTHVPERRSPPLLPENVRRFRGTWRRCGLRQRNWRCRKWSRSSKQWCRGPEERRMRGQCWMPSWKPAYNFQGFESSYLALRTYCWQRDRLSTYSQREYLGGVRPRNWTHCNRETVAMWVQVYWSLYE